jgi:hypothetical protein
MFKKLLAAIGLGHGEVKEKMDADHQDPRKRLVWCLLAVSPGANSDPAYRAKFADTALREWYGMNDKEELLENIDFYVEGTGSTPGYDAYRAVFMARAGFGAGMLSEQESWDAAFKVVRNLQQKYQGWNEYGAGYLEGHLAYREEQGDDSERLNEIRRNVIESITELNQRGIWTQTPFRTPV